MQLEHLYLFPGDTMQSIIQSDTITHMSLVFCFVPWLPMGPVEKSGEPPICLLTVSGEYKGNCGEPIYQSGAFFKLYKLQ